MDKYDWVESLPVYIPKATKVFDYAKKKWPHCWRDACIEFFLPWLNLNDLSSTNNKEQQ